MTLVYWHPPLHTRGQRLGYDSPMIRVAISLAALFLTVPPN
jgi:hypothetical protein